ncbi:hypothetical protein [Pectobacterium brasiliense]|uniref:hypothetical protein n=1 Tax=Pectobacterium brasiliense TaxID=180957 RepID=UPI0019696EE0|nr:hypothetical protein [Pectobacterium brasiliense]MBN3265589.1 hypothetical protein [Pectobacterium brasiliense]
MNIFSLFCSAPVAKLPSYTRSGISYSAKEFINKLECVKDAGGERGRKVSYMYEKTESYARKIAKSAEKGNIKDTRKNIEKFKKHSNDLFSAAKNPSAKSVIAAAGVERDNILSAFYEFIAYRNFFNH